MRRFQISNFKSSIWRSLLLFVAALALLPIAGAVAKDPPAAKAKPAKSLDKELLDDLDAGLPELPDNIKPQPKLPARQQPDKPAEDLDDQLKKNLGEGEDIEFGKPKNPLTKIGDRMRAAEQLIGKRNTSVKTQALQKEILTDLDALIARLEKQCQCAGPGQKESKPKSESQSEKKKSGESNPDSEQESKKPAEDSTERLGKPDEAKVEGQEMHELVRAAWGNLPARVRQQMQNASVEQFLPKYEKLIEEYYKRLAEEPK